jgi:hypothetical protein
MAETVGIWFAALLTLAIFSFLYKDNPFYKFAEHLFTGVSAAYWMVVAFWVQVHPNLFGNLWWPDFLLKKWPSLTYIWVDSVESAGQVYSSTALVDGTLSPEAIGQATLVNNVNAFYYLSRWPLAFVMGMAAGLRLYVFLQSNAMIQIQSTIIPAWTLDSFVAWANYLVLAIGVFTGLVYFYFSREHKGVFGGMSRVGVYFLMVSFGASFGYTVMARISLLLGRFQFLLGDWLNIVN